MVSPDGLLPGLVRQYLGLQYRFAGEQRGRNESVGSPRTDLTITMLAIYALLAVPFRIYSRPAKVVSAILFGLGGGRYRTSTDGYQPPHER
jgi:hypothetical protein